MREIRIATTWRAETTVEVADDYEAPNEGALELGTDAHGGDILEQIDASGAELVDWQIV